MREETGTTVVVGVDAHKRTHTLVVLERNGQEFGSVTIRTTSAGYLKAVKCVGKFGDQRIWALEDCRNIARRFEFGIDMGGWVLARLTDAGRGTSTKYGVVSLD